MKYLLLLCVCSTFFLFASTNYKADSSMSIKIKDKVVEFAKAIEQRDVTHLDKLLHENFRVVANQYPTEDKLSILSKEVYLSLMNAKKIGGNEYQVKFDYVAVENHSATVIAKFQGTQSNLYLTLLLIQNGGEWQIIEDLAIME